MSLFHTTKFDLEKLHLSLLLRKITLHVSLVCLKNTKETKPQQSQ